MSDVVTHRGDVFNKIAQPAQFTTGVARLHRRSYDDYTVAKAHVAQAIGDIGDMEIFGKGVLCAVFCRPNTNMIRRSDGTEIAFHTPVKAILEDWYQNKAVLILKCGPEAFRGDDTYHSATFGDAEAPKPGDWMFANANAGIQISLAGDGASRPEGLDASGEPFALFEWDGWPCRVIPDDQFYGRLANPQVVV